MNLSELIVLLRTSTTYENINNRRNLGSGPKNRVILLMHN